MYISLTSEGNHGNLLEGSIPSLEWSVCSHLASLEPSMQGQLDIFGFWFLRKVDDLDALNTFTSISVTFRPAVSCLDRFRGLIARIKSLGVIVAVLGVTTELPWRRSSLIPVNLLGLLVERDLTVGGLGRLAEAHIG